MKLSYVPVAEITRINQALADQPIKQTAILADIFRLNTLYMIQYAGSGHIGSSFSCMDILSWLWLHHMKHPNTPDGDLFFSSKGHDVPAFYALLIGLGKLPESCLNELRQVGGLPGQPDVHTPYIITNTGSLGMGISKARGMIRANRLCGKTRKAYVITGDGELQEGHFWESLQPAANDGCGELTVIVDHNKIQSDTWVKHVNDLGDLEAKFRAFGWEVARCDGHDLLAINESLCRFEAVTDKPHILIADTVKGKGVSRMESTQLGNHDLYRFHSGAPAEDIYHSAVEELTNRIQARLHTLNIPAISLEAVNRVKPLPPQAPEKLIPAYGEALNELAARHPELVVLDADLMLDCGLVPFKEHYPDRFIECGIAEQDMVSVAGGLALQGKLPVVHSFACFLTTRPNEQIYNNATEQTKIIYAGSLAGLTPATPGHSHQSVRDIAALGNIPGLTIIQPATARQTQAALRWAVEANPESTYIRLVSVPVEMHFLPVEEDVNDLVEGQGQWISEGKDFVLFAYGPVMLNEAVKAAQLLAEKGISLCVINLPWLNKIDPNWLAQAVAPYPIVFTLDDHYVSLGQGTVIASSLAQHPDEEIRTKRCVLFGLTEIPKCGQNADVLIHHQLDSTHLAQSIYQVVTSNSQPALQV